MTEAMDRGTPYSQEMWDFTFWKSENLWGTAEEWEAEAGRILIVGERMRAMVNLPKARAAVPPRAEMNQGKGIDAFTSRNDGTCIGFG